MSGLNKPLQSTGGRRRPDVRFTVSILPPAKNQRALALTEAAPTFISISTSRVSAKNGNRSIFMHRISQHFDL
jgi:hypothetical protein